MMQTQNLTPQQLAAILSAPSTQAAIAAQEAGRTAERGELLRELAEAELAAAAEADETTRRIAALRDTFLPLAAAAAEAREALRAAEGQGFAVGLAAEGRINGLRAKLRAHGGEVIEAARNALTVEARIAAGAFSWRSVTAHGLSGPTTRTEASPDNASVSALIAAIEDALLELDALERNADMGPGEIERRVTELRAAVESAKAGAPTPRRGQFVNPHGDAPGRRMVATMSSRLRR